MGFTMRIVPKEELARKKAKKKKAPFWQKLSQWISLKGDKKDQTGHPPSRRFLTAAELDQQSEMRFACKIDPNQNRAKAKAEAQDKSKPSGKIKKSRWKKTARRIYRKVAAVAGMAGHYIAAVASVSGHYIAAVASVSGHYLAVFFIGVGKLLWSLLQWIGQMILGGICGLGRGLAYLAKNSVVVPRFFFSHRRVIGIGMVGIAGIALLGLLTHYAIQYAKEYSAAAEKSAKTEKPPKETPKDPPKETPKDPKDPKDPTKPPKDPTKPPKDPGTAVLPGEIDRK